MACIARQNTETVTHGTSAVYDTYITNKDAGFIDYKYFLDCRERWRNVGPNRAHLPFQLQEEKESSK